MAIYLRASRMFVALVLSTLPVTGAWAAAPPTVAEVLKFKPSQRDVEVDTPTADEAAKCTVKLSETGGKKGWVLRDGNNQILRNFFGEKDVDQWSYYKDGVEVYRDIDSNHNRKPDQCRWLNSAGTRWGIDKNEDGVIDFWQVISPEEVSAEVVSALRDRDPARFERLLLKPRELDALGMSPAKQEELQKRLASARKAFVEYAKSQKVVGPESSWVYFGGGRPGTIAKGTDDSKADVTLYENVAALVETAGKNDQVPIGTLVKVGEVWRLVDGPGQTPVATTQTGGPSTAAADQPDQKTQDLMAELEKLDKSEDQSAKANAERADILEQLAKEAKGEEESASWLRQLADVTSAAVQNGNFPDGLARLEKLYQKLDESKDKDLASYVKYRHLSAAYNYSLSQPGADYTKIQKKWLEDLEDFVKKYPTSPDSADAMSQLALAEEFAGDDPNASKWYQRVVERFPKSAMAKKAEGAIRRLESDGKVIPFKGQTLGGKTIDLAKLNGKIVLIHYWATDVPACKNDLPVLEKQLKKYGDHFEVVGVCLDAKRKSVTDFVQVEDIHWPQVWEPGGLESRLATELGIQVLPTMILIDKQGKVLSRNIHADGLDEELKQHLTPKAASRAPIK